jgi:hypothetical protein
MTKEPIERALSTSLNLMLGLATLDLALFIWVGTSVVTVVAHAMSLWLFLRYRLVFDLVKILETCALIIDLYLINIYGYAVASPVAILFAIIHISLNKDYHLEKLKNDLDKVVATKQKDVENDKK